MLQHDEAWFRRERDRLAAEGVNLKFPTFGVFGSPRVRLVVNGVATGEYDDKYAAMQAAAEQFEAKRPPQFDRSAQWGGGR